ncbi:hypothetical protein D6764_03170 [Candidatus Woesearchaeota archaeon]|nr:MAG: hypothetical protein D6764_03170 [Candidatus Woesearchaeota archaeon]
MGATRIGVLAGSAGAAFLGYFTIIASPPQGILQVVRAMSIPGQIAKFMLGVMGNSITGNGESVLAMIAWLAACTLAGIIIDRI